LALLTATGRRHKACNVNIRLKVLFVAGSLAACAVVVWTVSSVGASAVRADEPLVPNAKISAKQAIAAAVAKGGAAESAMFSTEAGGRWEIAVAPSAGTTTVTYLVDPNSGQVTGEAERPLLDAAKAAIAPASAAVIAPAEAAAPAPGLADSIALAEKRVNGTAIEARIDRNGAEPVHIVSLSTLDGPKDVRVDAQGRMTVE
jgi:hypothetical protein